MHLGSLLLSMLLGYLSGAVGLIAGFGWLTSLGLVMGVGSLSLPLLALAATRARRPARPMRGMAGGDPPPALHRA